MLLGLIELLGISVLSALFVWFVFLPLWASAKVAAAKQEIEDAKREREAAALHEEAAKIREKQ